MLFRSRFLEKIWKLNSKLKNKKSKLQFKNEKLEALLHKTIKKVSDDIETMRFNTAVSALMVLVNELEKELEISAQNYETLLRLLAPFAPHIAEELWSLLGHKKSIHVEPWPVYDRKLASVGNKTLVIQVNGKVRGTITLTEELSEEEIKSRVFTLPEIKKWLDEKQIVKIIYVKDRLINIVVT